MEANAPQHQPHLQQDIRRLSLTEFTEQLRTAGYPAYRAKQIYAWLWQRGVTRFSEMTDLGKTFRQWLEERYVIHTVAIDRGLKSRDGTIKYGLRLSDGALVEGVLIPTQSRITACVSSQVGCSLTCKFCATGYMPLIRNLHAYEIYDSVAILKREAEHLYGIPLTNIVYMGMGEPLLNYRNVMDSIVRITSAEGLGMAPRRITLSTAGIAKMIKKLADDNFACEFALSLHAANDAKRSQMMPINDTNSLEALKEALCYFYQKTGTRVTYEYIIFENFNDTLEDAAELAVFARHIPSKINIIEYNPIAEVALKNTDNLKMAKFVAYLERKGLIVNVRRSRGRDVDGACGQLAIREKSAVLD